MSIDNSLPKKASGSKEGLILVLGSSLTIMGSVMVAPMIPKIAAEFGPTTPDAATLVPLAIAGPALAIAICAPLAGWLADRAGRKKLLIIATFLYALFGFVPAILGDLNSIVVSRLLFGCAEAAIMTCCTTLIADYWHGEERMKFVNFQVIAIGLIGSLFFVIGGILGEESWRTPFYLYLLPLLLIPFMLKVLWEPSEKSEEINKAVASAPMEKVAILPLIIGYLMILGGMVLNFVVPIQAPTLLVEMGITSTTQIGMSAGLGLLATLVGSIMWPLLRRVFGLNLCNAILLTLLAIGLWMLSSASTYKEVLFAVTVHGIGAGLMVPNVMAAVMNLLPLSVRGRGLGGFTSCLYLGQFISPIVIGIIISTGTDLHGAIYNLAKVSLVVAALWVIAALFLSSKTPTPESESSLP
ncbi:putative MFS family arabinose efflux permease [Marinomonas alcarazii]|uniref:MFS-type drug efflux transporter P55 n=1 Tax=Marinomonas alcarazii TaxID=491949 RepID=A0A318V2U7_9GAMM|nr:MFS transporter [Marinomonas alcarazii]PYF83162.1 putative MFS family arabinose efflux permease [Marinomonas alcarazii]